MKRTLITLLHSENRSKALTALFGAILLASSYTGTLPAPLASHKDWIDFLAFLVTGLSLVNMDPKREFHE